MIETCVVDIKNLDQLLIDHLTLGENLACIGFQVERAGQVLNQVFYCMN